MVIEGEKIKAILVESRKSHISWYCWQNGYIDLIKIEHTQVMGVSYDRLQELFTLRGIRLQTECCMEKKRPGVMRKMVKVDILKQIRIKRRTPLVIYAEKPVIDEIKTILKRSASAAYLYFNCNPTDPYDNSYLDLTEQDGTTECYHLRPILSLN